MPVQVNCPSCAQLLTVPDALIGQPMKCGRCQRPFSAGHPPSSPPRRVEKGVVLARRFEIVSELGQGAFGIVYHALDRQLGGRDVAIKMLRPEVSESAEAVDRLRAEAAVMARIVHPNILPVIEHGMSEGRYYIVLPLVRGQTLKEMIPVGGVEDMRRAVAIVVKIARALHHVWSNHRILHRDVKPSNILLLADDDESLYLMDFGLAACQDLDRSQTTTDGSIMGTPAYMPPEQARGDNARVSHTADIYSTGVVLFQLLTGTVPFTAPYPAVLLDIRDRPVPAPSTLRPGLPTTLDTIVLKALAKNPEHRYPTGQDLAKALEGWLAYRPATAPRPRTVPVGGGQPRARPDTPSTKAPAKKSSLSPPTPEALRNAGSTLSGQSFGHGTTGSTLLPPSLPPSPEKPGWGRLPRWAMIGAGAVLVLGLLLGGAWVWRSNRAASKSGKEVWWGKK